MSLKISPINTKAVQKAAKFEWPENVPVLAPNNMTEGQYSSPNGRHCLYQQVCNAFPDMKARDFVCQVMVDEINLTTPKLLSEDEIIEQRAIKQADSAIISFNDHQNKKIDFKLTSAVFNRTTARLGYTQGNPEAKKVKDRIIKALA